MPLRERKKPPRARRTRLCACSPRTVLTLAAAAASLDADWDERFVATRRLVAAEPALLRYVKHYRAGIKQQVIDCLAGKLGLDADDVRLRVLAELAATAFSISGRRWARQGGKGGRTALLEGFDEAVAAIPDSVDMTVTST